MQAKEKELDEDRIKQLNKQIRSGNLAVKWSMGGALVFLLGFCYVPLAIEHEKKWLIILIHFAIPLVDILVVYLTFPLMKSYLLKGIKQKLKNPELDDRHNKPLMAYNLIYICNVMIFGLALPVVIVVVLLKANTELAGVRWTTFCDP
jgi:hypothetical protein